MPNGLYAIMFKATHTCFMHLIDAHLWCKLGFVVIFNNPHLGYSSQLFCWIHLKASESAMRLMMETVPPPTAFYFCKKLPGKWPGQKRNRKHVMYVRYLPLWRSPLLWCLRGAWLCPLSWRFRKPPEPHLGHRCWSPPVPGTPLSLGSVLLPRAPRCRSQTAPGSRP